MRGHFADLLGQSSFSDLNQFQKNAFEDRFNLINPTDPMEVSKNEE